MPGHLSYSPNNVAAPCFNRLPVFTVRGKTSRFNESLADDHNVGKGSDGFNRHNNS